MKPMFSVITLLLAMMVASVCFATPTLTAPSTTNLGANMATLTLKSDGTGTGYFTLLYGSNASCGTGTQVKAGQTGGGSAAPYFGSLLLTADTDGHYTVRNLTQSTAYTVCFSADSPSGSNLNPTPVAANLTTNQAPALTNLDWSGVGTAGFSAGTAYSTSLAFAPDGTPYLAYGDDGHSGKATVMKFSAGIWNVVGGVGFSAGQASSTSLAFAPDGAPYVAYGGDDFNNSKATVMKYNGGLWSVVGDPENPGFSAGTAVYTSLAIAPDGTPHVAYSDYFYDGKTTVMKFSGGTWTNVGAIGFSAADAYFTSLAFASDGTPYVSYQDGGSGYKTTVKQYIGGVWTDVGTPGFSADFVGSTSLSFATDGTPYVAYSDYFYGGKTTVMKFNGVAWVYVGPPGFSAGDAYSASLSFASDGTPYVAYQDGGNSYKATVKKYSDGVWSVVGSAGFSAGTANFTSLAFAPDGSPYVAYGDDGHSSKATVMKLINLPPTISGTPAANATVGTAYSFTPTATYADSFGVAGTLPPGLGFSTATGALIGTPTSVGTYSNIVITATNTLGSASLPAFSITVVDSTPPDTTINSFPANPASSTSFTFAFTSTPSGSTFECSMGGGAYGTCTSPYSDNFIYSPCTACRIETAMNFAVRAKSQAGSTDPTPASYAWTINHTIGTLFANVLEGGVVQLKTTDFTGDLNFSRGVAFTLKGGYDPGYSTNSGLTNIHGTFTISAGTVTLENIVIM
jgi:hypothetical protein